VVPPLSAEVAWINARYLVPALEHDWITQLFCHPLLEAGGLHAANLLHALNSDGKRLQRLL
jgi:hypothetical protein